MSDAIGPGDFVECLSIGENPNGPAARGYAVGGVYIVSDVHVWCGEALLNCRGRHRPEEFGFIFPGWHASYFRPIRSDITSIERLLTEPIPADLIDA